MKTIARKIEAFRNIRKKTMEGRPREKISTRGRTTTHLMMTLIVIMIQKRCFFMAMDTKETTNDRDESEEEGEVDLEAKLISALEELNKEMKKKKLLKKELSKIRESTQDSTILEEVKQAYLDLKVKLEEAKMIEESLRKQLEEKEEIQVELEKEIVVLRRKLQKENIK